ncbi:MAG: D-alanyl-D-alanine carboxypeptidase [Oscillospiraceae bacterium]|nr:D-alanyl-D-alanine carboxypeptidase [Oscillospiraceae bacterium]
MFKKISLLVIVITLIFALSLSASALKVSADAAVLIEANSKEVIFGKNENKKRSMASTTKIMTALITLEEGRHNDVVVTTKDMVSVEGTSMGLIEGDSVTMKSLVYGMLPPSGNDAANVAAISIAGTTASFAKRMNERAAQIGMKNTNFVTPSGLDHKDHYSTAYDMALLGAQAIKNPEFRSICSSRSTRLSYGNPPYLRTLTNHNSLLKRYKYAIGIKTGFTKKSGRCLVSAAEKDGVLLIAVTLRAPNDWDDHIKMFDYGFSKYERVKLDSNLEQYSLKVVGGDVKKVPVKCAYHPEFTAKLDSDVKIKRTIEIKHFEYAPIIEGDIVGVAKYYDGRTLVCEVPIIASLSVDMTGEEIKENKDVKKDSFFEKFFGGKD